MPTPLTPTSSQEIIAISPPPKIDSMIKKRPIASRPNGISSTSFQKPAISGSKTISHMSNYASSSTSSSLPPASQVSSSSKSQASSSATVSRSGTGPGAGSRSTTLPNPHTFRPSSELKGKIADHMRADKYLQQIGEVPTPGDPLRGIKTKSSEAGDRGEIKEEKSVKVGKRKAREEELGKERSRLEESGLGRERITQRMMSTMGKGSNPITNSDLYTRTDHFVSSATGHQQSNAGGGSAGQGTYWEVRKAKMLEQAREQKTSILAGCVIYINGSTGPRVSNLQLQNLITANGGRFVPMQNGSCTHIIANGGLSGTKTQKWIDGQGGRGLAKRMKVINVDWVLDSVEKGKRVSEVGYRMIEDPSQSSLLKAFGTEPTTPQPQPGSSIDLTSP